MTAELRHHVASAFAHNKPQSVAVAVSGGGDSVALLRVMAHWAKAEGIRLEAVTVDHGLRTKAASEAAFVAELSHSLKIKHTTLKWTGWDQSGNLQNEARMARYRLMASWALGQGIETVALAHTADDQAETFFMRLARASGIDGLTGMARRREADGVTWVRPFLMQTRAELRGFLTELKQPWIDDPSNDDERFDRIKVRKALAGLEDIGIEPHVIGRVMDHLAQVKRVVDEVTVDHARLCVRLEHGDAVIERAGFGGAQPEVNRRLMSALLKWIASAPYGPRGLKLQEFIAALSRGRDATLHGVRLIGGETHVRLTREYSAVQGLTAQGPHWDGRWTVTGAKGVIRALGDEGLRQLGDHPKPQIPRDSLMASPAVFDGETLIAAPVARFGAAQAELKTPDDPLIATLLLH